MSLNEAMAKDLLTRAGVLSRVAELYDLYRWWEPLKVQMKLALQQFNGMEWTAPVLPEHQQQWVKLFQLMNHAKSLVVFSPSQSIQITASASSL